MKQILMSNLKRNHQTHSKGNRCSTNQQLIRISNQLAAFLEKNRRPQGKRKRVAYLGRILIHSQKEPRHHHPRKQRKEMIKRRQQHQQILMIRRLQTRKALFSVSPRRPPSSVEPRASSVVQTINPNPLSSEVNLSLIRNHPKPYSFKATRTRRQRKNLRKS